MKGGQTGLLSFGIKTVIAMTKANDGILYERLLFSTGR